MKHVEMNVWARVIAFGGAHLLLVGGFVVCFYESSTIGLGVGIYSMLVALALYAFLYPLKYLGKALLLFQQYIVCGCLLLALSAFPFFEMPTLLGAMGLALAGSFYLVAGFMKEKQQTLAQVLGGR
jgi:hypothetical protein